MILAIGPATAEWVVEEESNFISQDGQVKVRCMDRVEIPNIFDTFKQVSKAAFYDLSVNGAEQINVFYKRTGLIEYMIRNAKQVTWGEDVYKDVYTFGMWRLGDRWGLMEIYLA